MNVTALLDTVPTASRDVEQQARSVLRLFLEPISACDVKPGKAADSDPATCPNCGTATNSTRTPYCSPDCREVAGFVRQIRAGLADDSILDPDRQIAFGQVLWFILGGGRPLRRHLIPAKVRAQILQKAGGHCALCGGPAVTVDHIRTGCNRPINLRAVCSACDATKPFGDEDILNNPGAAERLQELTSRIGSPMPLRCCDDPQTWEWRQYLVRRQELAGRIF